jgi:hypothetical protein
MLVSSTFLWVWVSYWDFGLDIPVLGSWVVCDSLFWCISGLGPAPSRARCRAFFVSISVGGDSSLDSRYHHTGLFVLLGNRAFPLDVMPNHYPAPAVKDTGLANQKIRSSNGNDAPPCKGWKRCPRDANLDSTHTYTQTVWEMNVQCRRQRHRRHIHHRTDQR